jgi:hypothetical protein
MGEWIAFDALNKPDPVRWNAALLAEAQHINTGACANGRKERRERCWGTRARGLIGWDSKAAKMGIHARAAWEVDYHFHIDIISLLQNVIFSCCYPLDARVQKKLQISQTLLYTFPCNFSLWTASNE